MIASPGAVKLGRMRPSRDGPRLLKSEISSNVALGMTRVVPSMSTHDVLLTCEPTHRMRRAQAGIPMVFASSPNRNDEGAPGTLGKTPPTTAHMSNVPEPHV